MSKPNIVEIDFRCEGDITEKMEKHINLLENEILKILKKHGHTPNFEWEN